MVLNSPLLDNLLATTAIPIPSVYGKKPYVDELTPSLASVLIARRSGMSETETSFSIISSSMSSTISSCCGKRHPLSDSYDTNIDQLDSLSVLDEVDSSFYSINDSSYEDSTSLLSYSSNMFLTKKTKSKPDLTAVNVVIKSPSSSNNLTSILSKNLANEPTTVKSSKLSNLTRSLKNLGNAASSVASSAAFVAATVTSQQQSLIKFEPRSTDDKLPKEIQLKTYTINKEPLSFNGSSEFRTAAPLVVKSREPRVNSAFLRIYAHDYNSRVNGHLPSLEDYDYHYSDDVYCASDDDRLSRLSKDKLWASIILPPRDDLPSANYLDQCDNYVYVGNEEECMDSSKVRLNGSVTPWVSLEDCRRNKKSRCIKPCGVFKETQFTVKGWCNPRWVSST